MATNINSAAANPGVVPGTKTPRNLRRIKASDLTGDCQRLNLALDDIVRQIPIVAAAAVRQAIRITAPIVPPSPPGPPPITGAAGLLMDFLLNTDVTGNPPSVALAGEPLTVIIRQPSTPRNFFWGSISGSRFFFTPTIPLFGNTTNVVAFVGGADGNWYGTSEPILGANQTTGVTQTYVPSTAVTGTLVDVTLNADTTTTPPAVATGSEVLTYIIRQPATPHNFIWGTIPGSQFFLTPMIPLFANTVSTVAFIGAADGNWYGTSTPILGAV